MLYLRSYNFKYNFTIRSLLFFSEGESEFLSGFYLEFCIWLFSNIFIPDFAWFSLLRIIWMFFVSYHTEKTYHRHITTSCQIKVKENWSIVITEENQKEIKIIDDHS